MFVPAPPNQEVINAWIAFLTPIALAVVAVLQVVLARIANKNTGATEANGAQLDKIHSVVNGRYGEALAIGANALEKLAALTKDPADIAAAQHARGMASNAVSQLPASVSPPGLPMPAAAAPATTEKPTAG